MTPTTMKIRRGAALAFFAMAYSDQADEADQPLRGEIMGQLPSPIDSAALHAADTLLRDTLRANHQHVCIADLYAMLETLDTQGADRSLTPDLFGHYLAMQAMGTGVGLKSFGRAVANSIEVPYVKFGSHSLSTDYFSKEG